MLTQAEANKIADESRVVLKNILEDIYYGNWQDAQDKYCGLKCSAGIFMYITNDLSDKDIKSLTVLGFYARRSI